VTTVEVGDPVLLSFYSCGSCEQCQDSHPAYCASFAAENYFGRQGSLTIKGSGESAFARFFGQSSFSRHSVVAESSIVNVKDIIRDESELSLFAPLGCGFQTGMGAVQNVACATPDDIVVILGMGGVGMAALLVSRMILLSLTRTDAKAHSRRPRFAGARGSLQLTSWMRDLNWR
jgi:Zn-dependent alcohol dehydrogenase